MRTRTGPSSCRPTSASASLRRASLPTTTTGAVRVPIVAAETATSATRRTRTCASDSRGASMTPRQQSSGVSVAAAPPQRDARTWASCRGRGRTFAKRCDMRGEIPYGARHQNSEVTMKNAILIVGAVVGCVMGASLGACSSNGTHRDWRLVADVDVVEHQHQHQHQHRHHHHVDDERHHRHRRLDDDEPPRARAVPRTPARASRPPPCIRPRPTPALAASTARSAASTAARTSTASPACSTAARPPRARRLPRA